MLVKKFLTNILLKECVDLAVKYITQGNHLKLSEPELKSLISVPTAQTHFSFNASFYDQINGVAMKSPSCPRFS